MREPHSGAKAASSAEGAAFLAAVDSLPPSAQTACSGWNAHHIAAHLAAGAKEIADLIDESVPGVPSRPTRDFEERIGAGNGTTRGPARRPAGAHRVPQPRPARRPARRLGRADGAVDGDVTLATDAANRPLVLWGRKSATRAIGLGGDPAIIATLGTVLWPDAQPWPRTN